jgi:hypothetical protein
MRVLCDRVIACRVPQDTQGDQRCGHLEYPSTGGVDLDWREPVVLVIRGKPMRCGPYKDDEQNKGDDGKHGDQYNSETNASHFEEYLPRAGSDAAVNSITVNLDMAPDAHGAAEALDGSDDR